MIYIRRIVPVIPDREAKTLSPRLWTKIEYCKLKISKYGDQIHIDGEQARPDPSRSVLRVPYLGRTTCSRGRDRSQVPCPYRAAGLCFSSNFLFLKRICFIFLFFFFSCSGLLMIALQRMGFFPHFFLAGLNTGFNSFPC